MTTPTTAISLKRPLLLSLVAALVAALTLAMLTAVSLSAGPVELGPAAAAAQDDDDDDDDDDEDVSFETLKDVAAEDDN